MDRKEEKVLNVVAPEGYEVDEENSTFECIKFRKKWNGPKFKKGDVVVNDAEDKECYVRIVDIDSDKIHPAYLVNNPYMASWNTYYVDCRYFDERYKKVTTPIFKSGDFIIANDVNDIWKCVEVIGVKPVDRFSKYSYIIRRPDGGEDFIPYEVIDEAYNKITKKQYKEFFKKKAGYLAKFGIGDVVVDNFMEYLTICGIETSDDGYKSYLVANPYEDDRNVRHMEREFVEGHYWECTYPVFKAGDVLVKRHVGLSLDDTREELLRVICLEIDECNKYYYRVRTKNGEESIPYKVVDSFYYRATEISPSGLNGCKLDVGDIIRKPDEQELWRVVAVVKSLKSNDGIIYEIAEFHGGERGARYKLGRKYVEEQFEKVGGVYYEKSEEEHKFKAGDTVRSREDGSLYIILSIEKASLYDCYKYTPIYQVGRSVIYQSCDGVDAAFERVNDFCEDKDENYNRYYYLKKLQLLQSHLAHHNIATHVKVETGSELTSFSFADDNCFHTIYFGWYNSVKCEANFDHLLVEISKKYNFSIEDLKEWSER